MKIRILALALTLAACSKTSTPPVSETPVAPPAPAPAPVQPDPRVDPVPVAPVDPKTPPKPSPADGAACAERLLLLAAKKNVAQNYGNSPNSHGYCAMGVRTSLQRSHVGGVDGSLGNAIDFLHTIKPHGFVDNGARDPRKAAPGSVLVFSGPRTPDYLRTGNFGKPAGDWLGHVTIKGDDGRYYTDGRTREPAIGWSNGVNDAHRRNMAGILIPGSALASQFQGKCSNLAAAEQEIDLSLAASETAALPFEDSIAQESGRRLVRDGLAILERGNSPAAFSQALRLAREGAPFDDEGQLVLSLSERVRSDPSMRAELDQFFSELPSSHGAELCKTKVLRASLERALCLAAAGADGQDAPDSAACGKEASWAGCLALEKDF